MERLKKISIIAFIATVLILGTTYTVFAATGKITTATVRVREQATQESKTLTMIGQDEEVEILGKEGNWYNVKYNNVEGYIYQDYVEQTDDETITETEVQEETTNQEENVEETTSKEETTTVQEQVSTELGDTLNKDSSVYLSPNFRSIKIVEFKANDQVKIVSTLANWAKIEKDNQTGWIPKRILMKEVSSETGTEAETKEVVETPEAEEPEPEPVQAEETPINQSGYISSTASANIREGTSTETASLGKLRSRTQINVISEVDGWYKITYGDINGYIFKDLVTLGTPPAEDTSSRNSTSRSATTTEQTTETTQTSVATSAAGGSVASIAANYVGCAYVYGGSSPSGFDCSGFTSYVYSQAGISISRTSYSQATQGTAVSKSELQPGDLLIFSGQSHVGIYVGNGQFIHAANPSQGVRYDSINSGYWAGQYQSARRF